MKINVISAGYDNTQHNSIYHRFLNEKPHHNILGIVKTALVTGKT